MREWTYSELKEAIEEDISDMKDDGYKKGQIAGRCFYEYTTTIAEGYTEKIIVHSLIGNYIISECEEDTLDFHSDVLKDLCMNYKRKQLDGTLSESEIDELGIIIESIKERLKL